MEMKRKKISRLERGFIK